MIKTRWRTLPDAQRGGIKDFVVNMVIQRSSAEELLREHAPDDFKCPISLELMTDPVTLLGDGMTYERAYIESWLVAHDTSPLTNQPLAHKLLVPNIALKQAIGEMLERV